jgi:hypothetical protein
MLQNRGLRNRLRGNDADLPLNWHRGFFRVWLLVSAGWVMGWAIYLAMFAVQDGMKTMGDFLEIPIVLLGPPIALWLFGLAAGWAFRGFAPEHIDGADNS